MLNESKGNMYPFVTHTFNAIKGKCPHDCIYCYMKVFKQNDLRLDEKEFKTNLGDHNFIFVGSSTDMWAEDVDSAWITRVLNYTNYNGTMNKYLFQTKNPARFIGGWSFPTETILACTIETNRDITDISKAPSPEERYHSFKYINMPKMVSIEPVLDFDTDVMLEWIKTIKPEFVSIGADSKNHGLPEPSPDNLRDFLNKLSSITEIVQKKNLARLLPK